MRAGVPCSGIPSANLPHTAVCQSHAQRHAYFGWKQHFALFGLRVDKPFPSTHPPYHPSTAQVIDVLVRVLYDDHIKYQRLVAAAMAAGHQV